MANRQPHMPVREMSERSAAAGAPAALRARNAASSASATKSSSASADSSVQRVELGYLVRDVYIKVATRQHVPGVPDHRLAGDLVAETARKVSILIKRPFSFEDVLKHLRSPDSHS